jgi:hypothetical protein
MIKLKKIENLQKSQGQEIEKKKRGSTLIYFKLKGLF